MNRKSINRLFCILLTIALIIPCFALSYADDAEGEDVLRASNLEEYIEGTDPADPVAAKDDEIFSTCRLKVKKELDSLEGAVEGVSYQGDTLLRFASVAETKRAYVRLCKEYGENNVIVDIPLLAVESVSKPVGWGTEFMNIGKETERQTQVHGQNARKVTIAVIDSGIDSSHEIFDGRAISQKSKDFINSSLGITDENGNGTSVAGIISESAPENVELMILKTYAADGTKISLEAVGQAVRYAADNNADVINLSMSSAPSSVMAKYPELVSASVADVDSQLRYASEKGVIICASSGNDGKKMEDVNSYPAISSYTLAVGSVNQSGQRSYFSNYGTRLEFCAPGDNLILAGYNSNAGYYHGSGTSFAAPYISTCCAFVKMDNAKAGNQEAIQALKAISVDYGAAGWDMIYGWGMPKYGVVPSQPSNDKDREKAEAEAKAKAVTSVKVNGSKVTAASIRAAIAAAGGRNEYVTELVIDKGVKKISKNALKGTRIKTIIVRSRKLKKKSVKGSLKGSSVTNIKVKVGNKKANKKYVKKYKTYFTKKNAGRKVKVTR